MEVDGWNEWVVEAAVSVCAWEREGNDAGGSGCGAWSRWVGGWACMVCVRV